MNNYSDYKTEFYFGVLKSFSVHSLIAIITIATTLIIKDSDFMQPPSDSKIDIIKSAVKIDVVGMPKMTLQELKKMTMEDFENSQPIKEVGKETGGSEKIVFEQVEKKIDVSKLLAKFSQQKIDQVKIEPKDKKMNINNDSLRNLVLEGNQISKGNAIVGQSDSDVDISEFSNYATNLPNVIRPFWKLPTYLIAENLKCRIRIYIADNGELLKSQIYQSSGNEEYDKRAQDALTKVGKFPIPSANIAAKVASGSIVLGFPL